VNQFLTLAVVRPVQGLIEVLLVWLPGRLQARLGAALQISLVAREAIRLVVVHP
jgi:hypothetical protein